MLGIRNLRKLVSCVTSNNQKLAGNWSEYSVDTKDINLEILHFMRFYKYCVFEKDEEGYVKKAQKIHGCKSSSATGMRNYKIGVPDTLKTI